MIGLVPTAAVLVGPILVIDRRTDGLLPGRRMNATDIITQRLHTQRLAGTPFNRPEDMVQSLVGVQSQDPPGARWSVGQRTKDCRDSDVARAFDEGRILRTHVLRPTWHFVTPADIRPLLQLTAPRVETLNAFIYRQQGLDSETLTRGEHVIVRALEGGKQLTRPELAAVLEQAGIPATGVRLAYIVMHAELDALICSGAMRGKQHTYALLDERAPDARTLPPDDALAEVTLRFFTGHGPATLKEYVRWSSLTSSDARRGLQMVERDLMREDVAGETHWFGAAPTPPKPEGIIAYLLPEYDECVLTYTGLTVPDMPVTAGREARSDFFYRPVVIGGKRAGTWRRTITTREAVLDANLFATLDATEMDALQAAADRYGAFLELPVTLKIISS